jgi:uncharacterized lipoprotein YajG
MKKSITISTLAAVAIAAAVMAFAGVAAPQTSATPSLCHASKPSITAPASVAARTKVAITGSLGSAPAHGVTATLQTKRSTSKKWTNVASGNLSGGGYSLNWKAPAKKGTYKLRVRVAHASASNTSAAQTVTVN